MSPLPGGCNTVWSHNGTWVPSSSVTTSVSKLLYPCYFTYLHSRCNELSMLIERTADEMWRKSTDVHIDCESVAKWSLRLWIFSSVHPTRVHGSCWSPVYPTRPVNAGMSFLTPLFTGIRPVNYTSRGHSVYRAFRPHDGILMLLVDIVNVLAGQVGRKGKERKGRVFI